MNIDKNLIKYWSHICEDKNTLTCEDENPLTNNKDYEYYSADFVPEDDLRDHISVLQYLSKVFKKNPDEGIKLIRDHKESWGNTFEMCCLAIRKQLKTQMNIVARILHPNNYSGYAPFSLNNCYGVSLRKGIVDNDMDAYVETKDEALKLFDALKSISGGKDLKVFEIRNGKRKTIKEN